MRVRIRERTVGSTPLPLLAMFRFRKFEPFRGPWPGDRSPGGGADPIPD
ncbi:MAG: hypothetical protein IPP68_10850 [Elusimicrobia bacterium]|nr:hypothetical protein [Elusimicrobiota bacterium]